MGMAIIGIDVGSVRVGVAIADPSVRIAFPVGVWPRAQAQAERKILELITERNALLLVVGVPLDADGKPTKTCENVDAFVRRLAKRTSIKIEYVDEAFTSLEASERLSEASSGTQHVDAIAACLILERYFELTA